MIGATCFDKTVSSRDNKGEVMKINNIDKEEFV